MTKVGDLTDSQVNDFARVLDAVADMIYDWSIRKGFWQHEDDLNELLHDAEDCRLITQEISEKLKARLQILCTMEKLALAMSETGEQVEAARKPGKPCDKAGLEHFSNEEEEAADCIIRLLDLSARRKYRIGQCIMQKMLYNEGRPYLHGKQA